MACDVGALLGVHDTHFSGTAPSGRIEDYHGVHLVYRRRGRRRRAPGRGGRTAPPTPSRGCPRHRSDGSVEVLDVVDVAPYRVGSRA